MAAIGMPLLGDGLYGGTSTPAMQRQALHAYRLGFVHPFTGQDLQFESALPNDMQSALADMGLPPPRLE
jgi:23S rRNA pseudouridine1911/1915/1917 synthase